jgi:hypothetical protein
VAWAIDKKFNLSVEVREWFDDQNKMQLNDLPVYLGNDSYRLKQRKKELKTEKPY